MRFPLSMPIAGPLSYPITQYDGVGAPFIWILLTGLWVDFARWGDNSNWIDSL